MTTDTKDPRELIDSSPMSPLQVAVVGITVALNALDGYDVASISLAGPGIAREWGIERGALGIVLSMEVIGMAIGSLGLGGVADKIGRRRTILGCLLVMALGMFMVPTAQGLVTLSIWRVITGVGIGGMLAVINAVAAEFANARRRDMSVTFMSTGYPFGAVTGGLIVQRLLAMYSWRSVFYLGAVSTSILIPVVFCFVPESVHWLTQKRPAGALESINRTLRRFGHGAVASLPAVASAARKLSIADIFKPGLLKITILVTLAYFFHITTFYFIIKWVPNIVADFGFPASSAAGVLVWANVGGLLGAIVFTAFTQRFEVRPLTIAAMLVATAMVSLFGFTPHDLTMLSIVCAVAEFFINGAIVGLYALFARAFPTHVRAFGSGFAIGLGRGGSFVAPIVAGFLFQFGYGLSVVAVIMGLGSTLAAGTLWLLKRTAMGDVETPLPAVALGNA
jgi:MFS transporter, AAHS family, vanillate permease